MLIFCDFLKPKRRFIFSFFPLFPPFPLFTFRAATISLIHPLKFCFFGFKKSPKIVKTRWIYPSSNSKTWIEIWKSRWPINLLCWYPLKTEIHTNINHILHPPLLNTCTDSEYLYAVQFYNVNKTFVCLNKNLFINLSANHLNTYILLLVKIFCKGIGLNSLLTKKAGKNLRIS